MDKSPLNRVFLVFFQIISFGLSSCEVANPSVPTATVDHQATIDAVVFSTSTAMADAQQQTDLSAMGTTPIEYMPETTPISTPTADEVEVMVEEELMDVIDQCIQDVEAVAVYAESLTEEALADDELSEEEVETITYYVYGVDGAIQEAEELIGLYYDLYGELAVETVALLVAIEEELEEMAAYTDEVITMLDEINQMIVQGLEISQERIDTLDATFQTLGQQYSHISKNSKSWLDARHGEISKQISQIDEIVPNYVPQDRLEAIASAFDYLDAVKTTIADNKITYQELLDLAQLGANAKAGLEAHGGLALRGLANSIGEINHGLAVGDWVNVQSSLGAIENALGSRPSLPSRPSRP